MSLEVINMTLNPKKRILDLVAQGILTSDEALDLLENLDSDIDDELDQLEAEVIDDMIDQADIVDDTNEDVLDEDDELSASGLTSKINRFASDLVNATTDTLQIIRKMQQTSNFERLIEDHFDDIDSIFINLQKGSVDILVDDDCDEVTVKQEFTIQATDEEAADELLEKALSTSSVDKIYRLSLDKKAVNAQITVILPNK
jgi:hypothetical protein